jgi:signal transduction histidine kinase
MTDPTRNLARSYGIALATVALLSLAAQVIVQRSLTQAQDDGRVINLAGRQRMLSQALVKSALAMEVAPASERDIWRMRIGNLREEWLAGHLRLRSGRDLQGAGTTNSTALADLFTGIDPLVAQLAAASASHAAQPGHPEPLLRTEAAYLPAMDRIVLAYEHASERRIWHLRLLELALCATVLLALLGVAWLVFRPSLRRLRSALAERDHARIAELQARELETEARISRDIGMDLHDGVGQRLTALSLAAAGLERQLAGHPAQSTMQLLTREFSDCIAQVRACAHRLAPLEAQRLGLGRALQILAEDTSASSGVHCTCDIDATLDVHGPLGEDLLRIAQEAISNAIRHGHASRVRISLQRLGDEGLLSIADNGTGMGPDACVDGLGLRSMRLRASRVGGRLALDPSHDGGLRVLCRFPWESS